MIERTEHTLTFPHLPEALQGLRIVQLSDIHRSRLTPDSLIRQAVEVANRACPDLIVLTGDYVTDQQTDIEPCASLLASLSAPLGVYAILGNHDHIAGAQIVARALRRIGARVLINESVLLSNGLRIVGIEDDQPHRWNLHRAFAHCRTGEPTLVLAHNPSQVDQFPEKECYVLSGHTHGGQIHVPVLTAQKVRAIGSAHYRAGWYTVGRARLYVHRGLGCVGLRLRFRAVPEVAVFTLAAS